jgi:hypothetical protein
MQERRTAPRVRTNITARWETLRTEGRGEICDLSSTGCFLLAGAHVAAGELVRLDVKISEETVVLWGYVVYNVSDIGFALRFAFANERDQARVNQLIHKLDRKA